MNLFLPYIGQHQVSIGLRFLVGLLAFSSFVIGLESPLSAQNESMEGEPVPRGAVQLSHIEIQEQFIDYKKLRDTKYREEIDFGEVLNGAFDSTVAHYNYPVTMQLPHFLNTLTFHFTAIDWKSPDKIEYSSYLEGLEAGWGAPGPRSSAIYRNLSFGKYTLHVKAIGASQRWSKPFTYSFSIRYPWWRTWSAYFLYSALLFMIGIGCAFFWQQRRKEVEEMHQLLAAHKEMAFTVGRTRQASDDVGGFLQLVNHTLEIHLSDENFGIAELCEILNISRTKLHRKLRNLTGQSTSHYIRSLRLDIAKDMLADAKLNVSEVAFAVGFSSAAYFSKVFKEQFGYSPKEYR